MSRKHRLQGLQGQVSLSLSKLGHWGPEDTDMEGKNKTEVFSEGHIHSLLEFDVYNTDTPFLLSFPKEIGYF